MRKAAILPIVALVFALVNLAVMADLQRQSTTLAEEREGLAQALDQARDLSPTTEAPPRDLPIVAIYADAYADDRVYDVWSAVGSWRPDVGLIHAYAEDLDEDGSIAEDEIFEYVISHEPPLMWYPIPTTVLGRWSGKTELKLDTSSEVLYTPALEEGTVYDY